MGAATPRHAVLWGCAGVPACHHQLSHAHCPNHTSATLPLQGYGTFESPDGARYVGNWAGNLKHGIGKKTYANGDSYEGLWNHGKAEGPGRCGRAASVGQHELERAAEVHSACLHLCSAPLRRSRAAKAHVRVCLLWGCLWVPVLQPLHPPAPVRHPFPHATHHAGMCGTTATSTTASGAAARCTARARSNGSQVGRH